MKSLTVMVGVLFLGFALPASAIDRVTIKNATQKPLHYKMRCSDPVSSWKVFEAAPGEVREITAGYCNRFAFEKGTNKPDGSEEIVKYSLAPNTWHQMIYDSNRNRFDLRRVRQTDF